MVRIEGEPVPLPDGTIVYRPRLQVTLSVGKKAAIYTATVDSGADAVMVTLDVVAALGAKWDKLTDPQLNIGAGGTFETRRCAGQIYYQGVLITDRFRVAKEIRHEGELISLFLLGTLDFFTKFRPSFHWDDDPAWFDVEKVT